jgi:hypothetical protein
MHQCHSGTREIAAVGLTRDNRLQLVAVRQGITHWELAKVMRALGAYHAVALDGGTSTAMYFAGRFVANPGRGLTNVLLIYSRRGDYESARGEFGAAPVARVEGIIAAPLRKDEGGGFEPARTTDPAGTARPPEGRMPASQ